jgi:hypothetical protein
MIRKYILASLMIVSCIIKIQAQAPQKMNYQAVIRTSDNQLVVSRAVRMRISLMPDSMNATASYVETHQVTTNAFGVVQLEIGGGTVVTGTFAAIPWSKGKIFIKTETDPVGGTNYTLVSTTQMMSVPYAFFAKDVNSSLSISGDTLTLGSKRYRISGIEDVSHFPFPSGTVFCNDIKTEIIEVKNNITGRIWMDRNLGASRVAISSNDQLAYGDLFQWGRRSDGHQCINSASTNVLSNSDKPSHGYFITSSTLPNDWRSPQNSNLWQGANGINNPCPSGFRIPTESEWMDEISTWTSNDANGAFNSILKLTLGGYRNPSNGIITAQGGVGNYWSSTISGSQSVKYFGISINNLLITTRGSGHSVRCIKN